MDFFSETAVNFHLPENPTVFLFEDDKIVSVKQLIYNEIAKFYLGKPSILIPEPTITDTGFLVSKFKLDNDFDIANVYLNYIYNINLDYDLSIPNKIMNDIIKFYKSKFKTIINKYFPFDKSSQSHISKTPILIYPESISAARIRLKKIIAPNKRPRS